MMINAGDGDEEEVLGIWLSICFDDVNGVFGASVWPPRVSATTGTNSIPAICRRPGSWKGVRGSRERDIPHGVMSNKASTCTCSSHQALVSLPPPRAWV